MLVQPSLFDQFGCVAERACWQTYFGRPGQVLSRLDLWSRSAQAEHLCGGLVGSICSQFHPPAVAIEVMPYRSCR